MPRCLHALKAGSTYPLDLAKFWKCQSLRIWKFKIFDIVGQKSKELWQEMCYFYLAWGGC